MIDFGTWAAMAQELKMCCSLIDHGFQPQWGRAWSVYSFCQSQVSRTKNITPFCGHFLYSMTFLSSGGGERACHVLPQSTEGDAVDRTQSEDSPQRGIRDNIVL